MRITVPVLPLALLAGAATAQTQLPTPKASPQARVEQSIGISKITVDYHRPGVKDRVIWGELVPFGEVWRAGANEATVITFSDDVKIGDARVEAGTYGFFAIPGKESWTLILNGRAKQWGSMDYKEAEDALRITVKPEAAPHTEWMRFQIDPEGSDSANIELRWEKVRVAFKATFDVKSLVGKKLEEALANAGPEDWQVFMQAASFHFDSGRADEKTMGLVEKSISIKENWRNVALRAQILRKNGKNAESLKDLEHALDLAKKSNASKGALNYISKMLEEYRAS